MNKKQTDETNDPVISFELDKNPSKSKWITGILLIMILMFAFGSLGYVYGLNAGKQNANDYWTVYHADNCMFPQSGWNNTQGYVAINQSREGWPFTFREKEGRNKT